MRKIIFNEKVNWDTVLTRPFQLNKDITLYHMGLVKDPDNKVYPFGKQVGNKLGGDEFVSWWSEQPDETTLHLSQFIRQNLSGCNNYVAIGDIPNDGRGYRRAIFYMDKDYFDNAITKKILKQMKIYRYVKIFKIKDLHRGQEYAVHEWTCPDVVTADRVDVLGINDCIANGQLKILSHDEFILIKPELDERYNDKYLADYQKKPWIYYDYDKVRQLSKAARPKDINFRDQSHEMRIKIANSIINPKYKNEFLRIK